MIKRSATWGLLALFLSLPSVGHSFSDKQPVDISADVLEYNLETEVLTATGNVVVHQASATLTGDHMDYLRGSGALKANGRVVMKDAEGVLSADELAYDLSAENATVLGSRGYHAPWRFEAKEWKKRDDYYGGRDVDFTTCNLPEPHYHVNSSRLNLVPDTHFWGWLNTGYVEDIPIFFTPFLYRSLAARKLVFQVRPGHDSINGNFAKTVTTYRFTDQIYDKLLLDYYSLQGSGIGNEFDYNVDDRIKGSLFTYYIDPRGNSEVPDSPTEPQYNIRSYHWQRLSSTLIAQSNVNLRKNVSFNNQFFPEDTNQAVNDITSSMALTHQKQRFNQKIVVERLDAPDPSSSSTFAQTHIQSASFPRYELTVFQMPLWAPKTPVISSGMPPANPSVVGPLLMSVAADAAHTYQRSDDQVRTSGGSAVTFSQVYVLSPRWTLTPSLIPGFRWQDKQQSLADDRAPFRGFQGRIGTSEDLRWRPLNSLTIDHVYSLTGRLRPNGLGVDNTNTLDDGVETHHYNFLLYSRPSRNLMIRSLGGYDFRSLSNESPETYRARKWDIFTTELTYTLNNDSEIFLREGIALYGNSSSNNLGTKKVHAQNWQASGRFVGAYRTEWETSLLYNRGERGQITVNQKVGVYLSPSWRVSTRIYSIVPSASLEKAKNARLIETELNVRRELHCWYSEFIYRNRPPFSREYSILLSVKMGADDTNRLSDQQLESQFYPWRATTP